jgi:hypothetical protein
MQIDFRGDATGSVLDLAVSAGLYAAHLGG